ncbi:NUDIX hydrolase domain-like protein [Radiomyces spectabilis]|uniref:NUDIX hydrolase domain-like protein n=1 Tax=Radiomyces spectabilis TaxID=64574 RepID=UPI00221F390B|nr:NUDIX hydrolase domain-like protein [Radiomyces spectabilis]KAI8394017.1 NUDIX hydrolase domain-like protein [Radiomyces spectabilis]
MTDPLVRVGVGVIIKCRFTDGVKFLIGQRKGSHGAGAWQVCGGHLEYNESFEECARREALEETNLQLENPQLLTVVNDPMPLERKHYVTIFMHCEVQPKDISDLRTMEPEKLEGDWKWVTWNELLQTKPLFAPLASLTHIAQTSNPLLLTQLLQSQS